LAKSCKNYKKGHKILKSVKMCVYTAFLANNPPYRGYICDQRNVNLIYYENLHNKFQDNLGQCLWTYCTYVDGYIGNSGYIVHVLW